VEAPVSGGRALSGLMGGKLFCTFVFDILYIKMTLVSYLLLCR